MINHKPNYADPSRSFTQQIPPSWRYLFFLFCFPVHACQRSPKSTTSPTKVNVTTPFHLTQVVFILQATRVTM